MKVRKILLTILVGVFMGACSSEDIVDQGKKNNFHSPESTSAEIMSFESKGALRKHLRVMILQKELKQDPRTLFHLLMIFIMMFLKEIRISNR